MPRRPYPCATGGCHNETIRHTHIRNSEYCKPCRLQLREKSLVYVTKESVGEHELRAALDRALQNLDLAKAKTENLVRAVRQAATDAVASLTIPPVPLPKPDARKIQTGEVALAILADWQLGKKTPSYNSTIAEKRIEEYGDKVVALTQTQRADHPVREARVYLLGDLIEGEMIFPGQAHRIDASLFRQVLTDGPRILGKFIRRMAAEFEKVHVVGVIGNHGAVGGRDRREYSPETNADAMMYEVTRQLLAGESRVTWGLNVRQGERAWYAVDRVGEKGFLLFHGDQVKGGMLGFPWYGFGKKILGWATGGVPEQFNYALSGHFHTPVRGLYGQITHWGSGSTESDNTYAAEYFAAMGKPSQWLLFCHPRHGVTAEFEVHLG